MKLSVLVLMLCAFAAAAPRDKKHEVFPIDILKDDTPDGRNLLVNTLVTQLINYLRIIINNGSQVFDIPPLDPLALENFHINVPAGLININLGLKNIYATGFGAFVVHKSHLDLRDMTFDIDVSFPTLDIHADEYDMVGDLFGAIPLYGKGEAVFKVDDLRFQAVLHLKQSEDGKSILIDRIENTSFVIPTLNSLLTGAIGGGNIDAIVNAMIEDVVLDYINRFQSPISKIGGRVATALLNPILDQLDTWRYIAWLIPRN